MEVPDWLEDKICWRCDELLSVPFDREFVNGVDVCNDCAQEIVSELDLKELIND